MYGKILVPLDGSELAETALRLAELIPSQALRLMTVEPVKLSAARKRWARGEEWTPTGASWLVSSASAYLNVLAIPFREHARDVEVMVTTGKPGECIVEASSDVDLVVMATRGSGASRFLIGSVADYVARHATAPTLLLRDEHATVTAVTRLIVPLDGSVRSEEALPLAVALQRQLGAAIRLVRIIDPAISLATTDELKREAEAYLERQMQQMEETAGASREVRVCRVGSVTESLLAVAEPGDLFVMASRRRGHVGQLLIGSVAAAVVRRAPVPVVLVPATPGGMASALRGARTRGSDALGG